MSNAQIVLRFIGGIAGIIFVVTLVACSGEKQVENHYFIDGVSVTNAEYIDWRDNRCHRSTCIVVATPEPVRVAPTRPQDWKDRGCPDTIEIIWWEYQNNSNRNFKMVYNRPATVTCP